MLPNAASSAYPAWLDTAPPHSEPPGDEPSGEYVVDSDDFAPEDPVWDAFYAKPFILPPDPQPDWELMLS